MVHMILQGLKELRMEAQPQDAKGISLYKWSSQKNPQE